MKTTLELPDELVREIKLRAVHHGKKLKDTVTDLLRKGLAVSQAEPLAGAVIKSHPRSGLPYIECRCPAAEGEELTPDRVAELLVQQEAAWQHETG